jgi:hypothetical protein
MVKEMENTVFDVNDILMYNILLLCFIINIEVKKK